ncbi:hypothetical protein F5887DRAFT_1086428 [Amanita rubescens]|nr:hypothetical protein F5887DRAFT_1086428 [Amanita rubescens]
MPSSGYKFNPNWEKVSLDNEPGEVHRLIMQNSPELYFPTYRGRSKLKYSSSSQAALPFLPSLQPSSAKVACDLSKPPLLCSASAITDNDELYGAVRVGSQKRKAGQISADSSASDLSVIFSPRKKAKSKRKIDQLVDELEPYQHILASLEKDSERKYKKQIKELIQNLKDKGFLQASTIDDILNEAVHCCGDYPPVIDQFIDVTARVGSIALNSFDKQTSKEILVALHLLTGGFTS